MVRERSDIQDKILQLLREASAGAWHNDHQEVITCQWKVLVLSLVANPPKAPEMPSSIKYNDTWYGPQSSTETHTIYVQPENYRHERYVWQHQDVVLRRAIELFGRRRGEEVVRYGLSYVMRG